MTTLFKLELLNNELAPLNHKLYLIGLQPDPNPIISRPCFYNNPDITMDGGDIPKNLNTFLEEYLEKLGDDSKEIRRDLELIQELDEV